MRPLRLVMSAFGPYAGEQKLNFTELGDRSFFLIHGPTGAGKTTILDAMCFALYGDSSGAQRDGRQMRSDHAAADAVTEVTFDFAVGADVYRVKRRPEQERPKKHGTGTTAVRSDATLWRRTGPVADAWEGTVLAGGWVKVRTAVENLLGFKSGQFRQVVMLPQGEFRKLLLADSKERQVILETLFHIELYRLVEERLKETALEIKKKVEKVREQRKWILQQANAEGPEELSKRLQDHALELEAVAEKAAQSRMAAKQAQERLAAGQKARELLDEQKHALAAMTELEQKAPSVEAARQDLSGARQAAGLVDAENAVLVRRGEFVAAEKTLAARNAELKQAREARETALRNWAVEKDKEAERETVAREVNRLDDLTGKAGSLARAREELTAAYRRAKALEDTYTKAKASLTAGQSVIEEKTKLRDDAANQAARAYALEAACREAEQISNKRKNLEELRRRLGSIRKTFVSAEQTCRQAENNYARAKDELSVLQKAWHSGQAAVLAGALAAGRPCPVCGSLEHPHPAGSASGVPSEEEVKARQQQLNNLELYRDKVRNKASLVATEKATVESKVTDLENELGERAGADPAALDAAAGKAKQMWDRALRAEAAAASLAGELEALKIGEKTARERLELLEKELQDAGAVCKSAQAVVRERESAIPGELRDLHALNKARQAAISRRERLEAVLEQVRKAAEVTGQELVKAETAAAEAQNAWQTARTRAQEAAELFGARLKTAGFSDMPDYTRAKRTPEQMQRLEKLIKEFDTDLGAVRDRLNRAVQRAAGLTEPDLEKMAGLLAVAEKARDEALQQDTQLRSLIKQENNWLKTIVALQNEIEALENKYSVWGRLSEAANGKNKYGLTFQRFVLGALLDDVTVAATQRLKLMSRGRYHLQRTLERARSNAAGGLELEVFDTYTGVARGVATLSGGETFLASLSLALGLADVVQSYAGGMHLDTIFVDEGFGTLDPESLDLAMRALMDLQKGGRLVGIISHVPELKDLIDARLEIGATKRGSKACFKLA
ncbi:AAA family ATPase [Desulfoscipio gibsoniae]